MNSLVTQQLHSSEIVVLVDTVFAAVDTFDADMLRRVLWRHAYERRVG